jgi:hypothetical protein
MHDCAVVSTPSLYEQLVDPVRPGGTHGGRNTARSRPPCWTDALSLRTEIDDTARKWQPRSPVSTTPSRLRALAAKPWRPQDTSNIEKISGRITSWSVSVESLRRPASVKHVSAPCPAAPHTYTAKTRRASGCGSRRSRSLPNSVTPARHADTPGGRTCTYT